MISLMQRIANLEEALAIQMEINKTFMRYINANQSRMAALKGRSAERYRVKAETRPVGKVAQINDWMKK